MSTTRKVAYFSMEIGMQNDIPTYAGGLGVLAGDTLKAAADLAVPIVGVSLLYRRGYFEQSFTAAGWQQEAPVAWKPDDYFEPADTGRVFVQIEGRPVSVRAWVRTLLGAGGYQVPVILLDTDVAENAPPDRAITHSLYGGDQRYRLAQEVVLGLGGMRTLRAMGFTSIERFHMNEGHAALLTIDLLEELAGAAGLPPDDDSVVHAARRRCVFTTHTPVAAGHDVFERALFERVAGPRHAALAAALGAGEQSINMTRLAMGLSRYTNAVARKHGEVSRAMLNTSAVDAITNGVHAWTWASDPMRELFDHAAPGWRRDNAELRRIAEVAPGRIEEAHGRAKRDLLRHVERRTGVALDPRAFTIGFARRSTAYKRPDLLLSDPERLERLVRAAGPVQVVYAGKAHPRDGQGKEAVARIHRAIRELKGVVDIAFVPNYGMETGRLITSGVDLWLNNPEPPLEASGTSGMKAALNGVPNLSVLDGWWIEGCLDGRTGWAVAPEQVLATGDLTLDRPDEHGRIIYDRLERTIVPMFYGAPDLYAEVRRASIAINAPYFNTHRMVLEYVLRAYFSDDSPCAVAVPR